MRQLQRGMQPLRLDPSQRDRQKSDVFQQEGSRSQLGRYCSPGSEVDIVDLFRSTPSGTHESVVWIGGVSSSTAWFLWAHGGRMGHHPSPPNRAPNHLGKPKHGGSPPKDPKTLRGSIFVEAALLVSEAILSCPAPLK